MTQPCHRHTRYRLASCPSCRAWLAVQRAAAGTTPGALVAVPTR